MGKIATWGYILNDLGWGGTKPGDVVESPDVDENQCPTKSEINNYCEDEVIINGNYANNQLIQESDLKLSTYDPNRKDIDFVVRDSYKLTYKVKSYTAAGTVLKVTLDAHYNKLITLSVENGGSIEVDNLKPNAIFRIFIPAFMDEVNKGSDTSGRISFGLNSNEFLGYDWSSLDSIEIEKINY